MSDEIKKPKAALADFLAQANKPVEEQEAINPAEMGAQPEFNPDPVAFEASLYEDLSDEEKAELTLQAKLKVEEELRAARKKEFLKQETTRFRKMAKPGQEQVRFTIDLPGHSDRIVLDGTHYFHGVTYTVSRDAYNSMVDIAARAWDHEHEVGGANRDVYRAPINPIVRPGMEGQGGRALPLVKF